ncbi:uncharacterized protein LOC110022209 [Phalaenopsis equestris]|uniref:uncharacterized protein LOC110022209 n=1 Tax=Phalaenopsis equestris TaxID=78828 RepID=UPI0009E2288A|nr:uncharacterized protein LOC110022209 [Phalaenopsis equestris]
MGKFLKQYDREYMKMAMLKHEETFKHQVHELHRLYQIQKILMNEMKTAELKKQQASSNSENKPDKRCAEKRRLNRTLELELNAEEYIGKESKAEEGELELTLATGSRRRKKEETSFTSDSGASFSWSSAESSGVKLMGKEGGLFQANSFQSERKSSYDVEEQVRQNSMNQSPWLLQCLSLNMT